jgi:hypothetical protein
MLATGRSRSHSQGPTSVSSKSLMSMTRSRSGEAYRPKFDACASPQIHAVTPEVGSLRGRRPSARRCRAGTRTATLPSGPLAARSGHRVHQRVTVAGLNYGGATTMLAIYSNMFEGGSRVCSASRPA